MSDQINNTIREIKPVGGYFITPFLPAGLSFDNSTGIISGTSVAVSPANNYTVTAYNSLAGNFTMVNITVNSLLVNADLTALATNAGSLSPVFAPSITSYTEVLPATTSSVTVTPVAAAPGATIKVNGTVVMSGAASAALPLVVGANAINAVVTAQDGTTTKTYTLTVTRLSNNAALTTLKISPSTSLMLVSGADYKDYTTTVPNSETSVKITPTAQDATASIKVNGVATVSGTASAAIPLSVGDNVVNTVVTAQDGVTTKTYSIKFTRLPSSNANLTSLALSSGTLTPVFAAGTISYTASVSNTTASIKVTPTVQDAGATVKVNGTTVVSGTASAALPLVVGPNTITTVVTAQDGVTTKTYTVTVTRVSNNALLTQLKVIPATALTIVSGPDYVDYTATVPNTTSSVQIMPTSQSTTSTIKVNGVTVASGTASAAIPLSVGDNVVNTVVTAQDGVTTKTYSIKFTRQISVNANLAGLKLSSGTLTPVFAAGTISYTAMVTNATNSITVTPATSDAGATVKVNGTTVASGTASAALPLVIGPNTVTTVVTAPDGVTTKTYTLTVTRPASNNALLTQLKVIPATTLTIVSGPDYVDYTATVPNTTSSVQIMPTSQSATSTIKVNGVTVASGTASGAIALNVGTTVVNTVVTAQDDVTTKTYSITFTRPGPVAAIMKYDQQESPITANSLTVHQNVSPNGDGNSDVLVIDGITAYPENKLQIMSRSGALVYEAKGYDNETKAFDGHSSINGKLQQVGTYFYSLEYKDGKETKHKTGFIVLKY
ncbi:cadherin-like beta sandwich domain-containing protein [Mucilaginibacter flavidus]|uniref:cadherin-like beta sandwich domain-containing protein n=1 Tax=Mucilaginibacter flavidus TaxID=2949309 RepID=UPI002093D9D4|nr:cadherin-like beta sandwich domain-containing protein [Mucilaginibacter flavidus]